MKVIIIGGGWSGCAAAITAKKAGIKDISSERADGSIGAFSGSGEISKDSSSEEIIKELERVRFMDPYSGGRGNSIRFLAAAPRGLELRLNPLF